MKKVIYEISGMHCKSCEILIENKLKNNNDIEKINVDCKKGIAEIYYQDIEPNEIDIKKDLISMGYNIIKKINENAVNTKKDNIKLNFISKNKRDYKEILIAILIFATLYMLFGILKIDKVFAVDMSATKIYWTTAILIGLTAGVSTCMALVGGLVAGISARFAEKYQELSAKQKFIPIILFNIGRIFGFFIFGGILGVLGSTLKISTSLTGILTISASIFMFLLGIQLLNIFPILSNLKLTLPKSISRLFGITNKKNYSHKNSILLGALTFFLPCGFTQAMQICAMSSTGFMSGGLIMGLFALGTAPGLIGIGGIISFIKEKISGIFFKIIGIGIITFALFNFLNGYNLTLAGKYQPKYNNVNYQNNLKNDNSCIYSSCPITENNIINQNNDVQIIKTSFDVKNDINPNIFNVKINVPVRFEIDAKENGIGCMSTIMIPGIYNEAIYIKKGVFSLTFTPTKIGKYPITCAMGVSRGNLIVQ